MFTSRNSQQTRIQNGRAGASGVGTASVGAKGTAAAGAGAGTKIGAGHKPQAYDAHGRYTGPNVGAQGGSVSMRDGLIRMYARSDGKRAGADSEFGRQEPTSLLSATAEQLDKITSGTGQAVRQGAQGARQALSRTWEELSTNKELREGVEFGARAAVEVSKDVWKQAGTDAATAAFGRFRPGASEGLTYLLGTLGGLAWKGINTSQGIPSQTRALGERINTIKAKIYDKE